MSGAESLFWVERRRSLASSSNIGGEWFVFDNETKGLIDDLMGFINIDKTHKIRNAQKEAAKSVGVSVGYVSDAKVIREKAPALFVKFSEVF